MNNNSNNMHVYFNNDQNEALYVVILHFIDDSLSFYFKDAESVSLFIAGLNKAINASYMFSFSSISNHVCGNRNYTIMATNLNFYETHKLK